ncbi:MAG: glycosyltransferase [Bacteroidia bacterium]|nr:glycosyltransferase [Bacteroidia bacterium]
MAKQAHDHWMSLADDPKSIEYAISLDTSDNTVEDYKNTFKDVDVKILMYPNRSIVDAVNNGANWASGDIFVVVSDDFEAFKGWDTAIIERLDINRAELLHTFDTIQNNVCTLPILTKKYFELFGHIYHPHYISMFADDDMTECAKLVNGYVEAFDLVFAHNHWVNGKNPKDKTYDRENSKTAWEVGKRMFQQRKARRFDLV